MNSGLNEYTEFSYLNIVENYNIDLLNYMLGKPCNEKHIKFISVKMKKARELFLAASSGDGKDVNLNILRELIFGFMEPGLEDKSELVYERSKQGGTRLSRKRVVKGGENVCRDPTLDDGVLCTNDNDDRLNIRVTDINKYRSYLEQIKTCNVKSAVQAIGGNPTRKKITEKQYYTAKKSGKNRVARYKLKDKGYVHYMYQYNF